MTPHPIPEPQPTPTCAPTENSPPGNDLGIVLAAYDILYTLDQSRIPNLQDYSGVSDITEEYLGEFFDGVLGLSEDIIYTGSTTEITDRSFLLGQPVRVEYNTTIYLSSMSALVPSDEELNALLMSAFRGGQNAQYVETVQSLPPANIFSTTTAAEFVQQARTTATGRNSDSGESSNTQRAGVASAAAAGAFVLLLTGYAMYRRRSSDEDHVGKFLDNDGHVTVADDTYVGGSSLDSQSGMNHISRPYQPSEWGDYLGTEGSIDPLERSGSPETTLEDLHENESSSDDDSESESSSGSIEYECRVIS
jgi:hypothetical protein